MPQATTYRKIIIKPGREYAIRQFHPWVFSGAVADKPDDLQDGELVELYSEKNDFLALGFWANASIAVKLLSFAKTVVDESFWMDRIAAARHLRQRFALFDDRQTNAYRIFNAEGDGIPGLIIDYYNGTAVMQVQIAALQKYKTEILAALLASYSLNAVIMRDADGSEVIWGNPQTDIITENGISFHVDLLGGQKTGFFLDQRENRALVGRISKEKKVLNAFCYSGGFSLYALKAGAAEVTSVDYSQSAMTLLERNLTLNDLTDNHKSVTADFLNFIKESRESYDLIVLDPPAFSKHRSSLDNALKGYVNLNLLSLLRLSRGGMFLTFSCSQLVSVKDFREAVTTAASRAGRRLRVVRELGAADCHVRALAHPEGSYLKGLLLSE